MKHSAQIVFSNACDKIQGTVFTFLCCHRGYFFRRVGQWLGCTVKSIRGLFLASRARPWYTRFSSRRNSIGNIKSKTKMVIYWLLPSNQNLFDGMIIRSSQYFGVTNTILLHLISGRYWRMPPSQRNGVRPVINECFRVSSHETSTKGAR